MTFKELLKISKEDNINESDLFYLLENLYNIQKKDVIQNLNTDFIKWNDFKRKYKLLKKSYPAKYITGFDTFENVSLRLNKNTLIPREETKEALLLLKNLKDLDILDIGTGSGIIAIYLAKQNNVTAIDISNKALKLAKKNAKNNGVNINFIKSNIFKKVNDKFDVIISNPPYVPTQSIIDKSAYQHEPHSAIFAGEDGLDIIVKIIDEHKQYVKNTQKYLLIIEIDSTHKESLSIFCNKKNLNFKFLKDFNDKNRYIFIYEGKWECLNYL